MNSDSPRLRALNLLKLSSIAYLEAHEKHGEAGAVAASRLLFNDYNEALSSREHRDAAPFDVTSAHTPEFGLDDDDINEIVEAAPCAGKYELCKAQEVTDDDVKALVNLTSSKSNHPANSEEDIFEDIFEDIEMKESTADKSKLRNARPYFQKQPSPICHESFSLLPPPAFNSCRSKDARSPPRKIIAEQQPQKLIDQINKCYKRSTQAAHAPVIIKKPVDTLRPSSSTGNQPTKDPYISFTSASRELQAQNLRNYGNVNQIQPQSFTNTASSVYHPVKSLGGKFINKPFKSPLEPTSEPVEADPELNDPLLFGIDPKILETIKLEIIDSSKDIAWNDIAGLGMAKETIQEAVVLPLLRPDLFTGLRSVPKGILLFGPPGTGKTLIGKCISSQSKATFFSISASSLTSKWIGDGEKLVKALFRYARYKQPSVIFLDEIDSVLTKRSDSEHEASRRLKTEFLIQLEGAHTTTESDRVLLVGATNRPHELDDAARRRFTKRLYIPLPEVEARQELIINLMKKNDNSLTHQDVLEIAQSTDGYSGADIKNLCADAAMTCLRELSSLEIANVDVLKLRPMKIDDFRKSLKRVKATVSQLDLQQYVDWDRQYGST